MFTKLGHSIINRLILFKLDFYQKKAQKIQLKMFVLDLVDLEKNLKNSPLKAIIHSKDRQGKLLDLICINKAS